MTRAWVSSETYIRAKAPFISLSKPKAKLQKDKERPQILFKMRKLIRFSTMAPFPVFGGPRTLRLKRMDPLSTSLRDPQMVQKFHFSCNLDSCFRSKLSPYHLLIESLAITVATNWAPLASWRYSLKSKLRIKRFTSNLSTYGSSESTNFSVYKSCMNCQSCLNIPRRINSLRLLNEDQ